MTVAVSIESFFVELPEKNLTIEARVGHMDPVTEDSGLRKRLTHLGYGCGPLTTLGCQLGKIDLESRDSLRLQLIAFQLDHDLEVTGEANDETRTMLIEKGGA